MRTCIVLQSAYLPWCGYFDQMGKADIFVIYDDVQFSKGAWQNRNRIKTPQGVQWLTVPVLTANQGSPLIKDVMIDNSDTWARKHWTNLKQNYARAKYTKDYIGEFEKVYAAEWGKLVDLNMALTLTLCGMLNIRTPVLRSSELGISGDDRVLRLVDICSKLGADEFLEGSAGRNYLAGVGERLFAQSGIKLIYQDYVHPVYSQLYGAFVPYLSVLDLLFNHGPDSLAILTGRKEEK